MQIISGIQSDGAATRHRLTAILLYRIHGHLASVCQTKKLGKGENDMGSIFSQNPPPTAHRLTLTLSLSAPLLACCMLQKNSPSSVCSWYSSLRFVRNEADWARQLLNWTRLSWRTMGGEGRWDSGLAAESEIRTEGGRGGIPPRVAFPRHIRLYREQPVEGQNRNW